MYDYLFFASLFGPGHMQLDVVPSDVKNLEELKMLMRTLYS